MSGFQWSVVAIMVGLNALDGFDVLSISFASPGITEDWGMDRAALGIVLSMELLGMAVGSLLLGGVADRIGRRNTILSCLVVMTAGMFLAATVTDVVSLSVWRVLTGLGIGGMLAATNAAVAEASNTRRRNLCVVLMASGYPIGAVVGGGSQANCWPPTIGGVFSSLAAVSRRFLFRWCSGGPRSRSHSKCIGVARTLLSASTALCRVWDTRRSRTCRQLRKAQRVRSVNCLCRVWLPGRHCWRLPIWRTS